MIRLFGFFFVILFGCAHARPGAARPTPPSEQVLERGGDLADADAVRATLSVSDRLATPTTDTPSK